MDTLELATDTFDSEAAERKRCLQANQPFQEEQKWDEEVKQCMAVLHENVREAHADILEEMQHKRALAEQSQMQAGGAGVSQAVIAAEAAARVAPSSPAARAAKASATKPAAAATPRAEEVPKKPSGRRPSSGPRVPSPAPQVEPTPAESTEDALATAAAVDSEAPVASEERLSVQSEVEIDELAPAEDVASDPGSQAAVDVHSLAEETVEKTQETERLTAKCQKAEEMVKVRQQSEGADKEIEKLQKEIEKVKSMLQSQQKVEQEAVPGATKTNSTDIQISVTRPALDGANAEMASLDSPGSPDRTATTPQRQISVEEEAPSSKEAKVQSLIKSEARKKKRLLQLRNAKLGMLNKLLEQAGLTQELRPSGAPETVEERAARRGKELDNLQERNRRLSKQLEFWDQRIEHRKTIVKGERKQLRKEFGKKWERKLEQALLGREEVEEPESDSLPSSSSSSESEEPSVAGDETEGTGLATSPKSEDGRQIRIGRYVRQAFKLRDRTKKEPTRPNFQGTRPPLSDFPMQGQAGRQPKRSSLGSDSSSSEDVPLVIGGGGSLADHIMNIHRDKDVNQDRGSFLEGLQRIRPSARYYTRGPRRLGPGGRARSKRRVSIRSFVEDLSDDSRRSSVGSAPGATRQEAKTLTGSLMLAGVTSRVASANIETPIHRSLSEGDIEASAELHKREDEEPEEQVVNAAEWLQEALRQNRRRARRGGRQYQENMHLETVRLLHQAARMASKTQKVHPESLLGGNSLTAGHLQVSSRSLMPEQPNHLPLFKMDSLDAATALQRQREAAAWTEKLNGKRSTARRRFSATKARLIQLDGVQEQQRSSSKKEPLRSFSRSKSRSSLPSKSGTVAAVLQEKQRALDAQKEIARMKLLSLHHSAARRRALQARSPMSDSEEGESTPQEQRQSIMGLAAADSADVATIRSSFRGGDRISSRPSIPSTAPVLDDELEDEDMVEARSRWLGDRDSKPRASRGTTPGSQFSDLFVGRSKSEAEEQHRKVGKTRSRARTVPADSPIGSSGSEEDSPSSTPRPQATPDPSVRQEQERGELLLRALHDFHRRRRKRQKERSGKTENLYFRNVAYFIDLMDENDTARRHRERKESKRRLRKEALKQQERLLQNVFRGDVRRQSQMRILVESRAGKEEERSSVDNEKRAHEFALIHVAKACKYEPPLTADGSSALKVPAEDQLWGLLELEGHSDYLLLNRLRVGVLDAHGSYRDGWHTMSVPGAVGQRMTRGSLLCGMKKLGFTDLEAARVFHLGTVLPLIDVSMSADMKEEQFLALLRSAEPIETMVDFKERLHRRFGDQLDEVFRQTDVDNDETLEADEFAELCFSVGGSGLAAQRLFLMMVENQPRGARADKCLQLTCHAFSISLKQAAGLEEAQTLRRLCRKQHRACGEVLRGIPSKFVESAVNARTLREALDSLEIDVHERPLVRLARWRGKVVWVQDVLVRCMAGLGQYLHALLFELRKTKQLRHEDYALTCGNESSSDSGASSRSRSRRRSQGGTKVPVRRKRLPEIRAKTAPFKEAAAVAHEEKSRFAESTARVHFAADVAADEMTTEERERDRRLRAAGWARVCQNIGVMPSEPDRKSVV